jgi:transcriptional regulator with XRE-family HTH domain
MGTRARRRPARLAEKLLQIRTAFGLSQNELINNLGLTGELIREEVSDFERDVREPSLPILSAYARAAGVWLDVLVDDDLDLPDKLPSVPKHEGVRRKSTSRSKRKR